MNQATVDPERKRLSVDLSGIDYARQAERSPRDHDRLAPDGIVDHLSSAEVVNRIRNTLAADGHSDYGTEWPSLVFHFADGDVNWVEDCGDEVARADSNDRCSASIFKRAAVFEGWRLRRGWSWSRRWCGRGEGRGACSFPFVRLFEGARP